MVEILPFTNTFLNKVLITACNTASSIITISLPWVCSLTIFCSSPRIVLNVDSNLVKFYGNLIISSVVGFVATLAMPKVLRRSSLIYICIGLIVSCLTLFPVVSKYYV